MTSLLATYFIGLCATTSLLMAWFFTSGPIHLFHMARRLGYRKRDARFWESISPEWESTWLDFEMLLNNPANKFPDWLGELFQCRYCLSFHMSFWVSLACTLLAGYDFMFCLAATFSWPYLANFLLTLLEKNRKS